jgi:hypothetical protein
MPKAQTNRDERKNKQGRRKPYENPRTNDETAMMKKKLEEELTEVYEQLVVSDEDSEECGVCPRKSESTSIIAAAQLRCIVSELLGDPKFMRVFKKALDNHMDWLEWSTRASMRCMEVAINRNATLRPTHGWASVEDM